MLRDDGSSPPSEPRGPPRYGCPECPVTGHEFALRSHLLDAHGWTPAVVEEFFSRTGEPSNRYASPSQSGGANDSGGPFGGFGDVFQELFETPSAPHVDPTADGSSVVGYDAEAVDTLSDEDRLAWMSTNFDRMEAGERTVSPEAFRSSASVAADDGPAATTSADDSSDPLSRVCDCDPKFKETQIIQKDTGLNLGAIGGNRETGVPVIICKNCADPVHDSEGTDPGWVAVPRPARLTRSGGDSGQSP